MTMRSVAQIACKLSLGLLLLLMVLFPTLFQGPKTVLLLLTLLFAALNGLDRASVSRKVLLWMLVYLIAGAFFLMLSFTYGNDASSRLPLLLFEPLVFFLLIVLFDTDLLQFSFYSLIPISYIVIAYNAVFMLSANEVIPLAFSTYMPGITTNIGGVLPGFVKYTSENITWLMFLTPLFTSVFLTTSNEQLRIHSFILVALFLLNAVLCFRTAFFFCIAIGFVLPFVFARFADIRLNEKSLIITAILIIVVILAGLAGPGKMMAINVAEDIIGSFAMDSSTNALGVVDGGVEIRKAQLDDLLYTWSLKPILGWGDPSNSLTIVRSDVLGAYELSYAAMLMQRGIVGMLIYIAQTAWLYYQGYQIAKKNSRFAQPMLWVMVAFSAALFVNFTNPFFGNFDRLIIQFIPLAVINRAFLEAETCAREEPFKTTQSGELMASEMMRVP